MHSAVVGVLASRSPTVFGESAFYTENPVNVGILLGPKPNTQAYTEINQTLSINLGPPPNSLFYTENNQQVTGINFGPPPNTLFYNENPNGTPVILLSATDFILVFTENQSQPLPLAFANISNSFEPGSSDASTIDWQLAPGGEDTLFFSLNDDGRQIPIAFGS